MAPPTTTQRLEILEAQMTELHTSIAERITTSVGIAMEAAKATIAEQISASMDEALRKSKEEQELLNSSQIVST